MLRIGYGYDVHRLVAGRKLILGGVEIPFDKGLEGHSDADVVLHSVIDGLLGALSLGDIGSHFPDTDPQYEGIDSRILLQRTFSLVQAEGYVLNNLDCTICAERPKLQPYLDKMRENLAKDLACDISQISLKATTVTVEFLPPVSYY
jgi:2-C-methyl-D-erythritol 2,4-cyclodiphosphate synthase